MPEVQQRLSLVEKHEESLANRVRQRPERILPVLPAQNEIQKQLAKAHSSNSLWITNDDRVTCIRVVVSLHSLHLVVARLESPTRSSINCDIYSR